MSILLFTITFFLPYFWVDMYDRQTLSVLIQNGVGAKLVVPDLLLLVVTLFYLTSKVGLLFSTENFRYPFLFSLIIEGIVIALNGVIVDVAMSSFLVFILTILDGCLIAIIFNLRSETVDENRLPDH